MIMYSDKQVICVKDISSNMISEAIFILKPNVVENLEEENEPKTREMLLSEAEEIVEEYMNKMQLEKGRDEKNIYAQPKAWKKDLIYIAGLLTILGICLSFVI